MRRIRAGVILSVGLAVASCGGGSSTEPEDSLTPAEALALLEVTMNPGLQLLSGDEINEIVTPGGASLQFTGQCTIGGTVAVDAQVTPSLGPGDDGAGVGVSATLVHADCMERHTGTGITFTVDGAPEVEMSIELSISTEFMFEISGTVAGTVQWATGDGRSGSCRMDVDLESVDDPDALLGFSITVAGQACGAQINESFSGAATFS